jgi:hypothetical protein
LVELNQSENKTESMKENTNTTTDSEMSVNNDTNNNNERWVIYNHSKGSQKVREIIERNTILLEEAIEKEESEEVITEKRDKVNEWMIKGGTIKRRNKVDEENGDIMIKKITIHNTPSAKRDYFIKLLGNNKG